MAGPAQLPAVEVWAESDGVAAAAVAVLELESDELVSELVSLKLLPAVELVSVELVSLKLLPPLEELASVELVALELVSAAAVAVAELSVLEVATVVAESALSTAVAL